MDYISHCNGRPFKIKIKFKKFQLRRILSFYEADFSCDHFFFYFINQGDITFNFLSNDILILDGSSIFGKFSSFYFFFSIFGKRRRVLREKILKKYFYID